MKPALLENGFTNFYSAVKLRLGPKPIFINKDPRIVKAVCDGCHCPIGCA